MRGDGQMTDYAKMYAQEHEVFKRWANSTLRGDDMEHTKTAICPNCLTPSNTKAINAALLSALEHFQRQYGHESPCATPNCPSVAARAAILAAKGDTNA